MIMHPSHPTRRAGFSLIEVMCAVLILGVGIAGITTGITTALTSSKEAERQTTAALLAAGRLETLRAEGYVVAGEEEGEGDDLLSNYQWRQTISPTAVDGLFDVKVRITWAGNGELIYELETMLFDPPVYSTLDDTDEQQKRQHLRP